MTVVGGVRSAMGRPKTRRAASGRPVARAARAEPSAGRPAANSVRVVAALRVAPALRSRWGRRGAAAGQPAVRRSFACAQRAEAVPCATETEIGSRAPPEATNSFPHAPGGGCRQRPPWRGRGRRTLELLGRNCRIGPRGRSGRPLPPLGLAQPTTGAADGQLQQAPFKKSLAFDANSGPAAQLVPAT